MDIPDNPLGYRANPVKHGMDIMRLFGAIVASVATYDGWISVTFCDLHPFIDDPEAQFRINAPMESNLAFTPPYADISEEQAQAALVDALGRLFSCDIMEYDGDLVLTLHAARDVHHVEIDVGNRSVYVEYGQERPFTSDVRPGEDIADPSLVQLRILDDSLNAKRQP